MSERAKQLKRESDLASRGVDVNPCNSPSHPAATLGVDAAAYVSARPRRSLQQAYDPQCIDFVSGVATPDTHGKIGLETFRCDDEEQQHQRVVERSSVRDEERGHESRSRAFRDELCRGCYFRGLRQKHLRAFCQSEER